MKAYTDLEQSKKLAEILPIESADMCFNIWRNNKMPPLMTPYSRFNEFFCMETPAFLIPCWSLAALLDYLCSIDMFPSIENDDNQFELTLSYVEEHKERPINNIKTIIIENKELINACVELIIKLNEKKLL